MKRYRVWMYIRGTICKPPYDGYVDVYAEDTEAAGDRAIREARRTAHWDSPYDYFRIERVEER